MAWQDNCSDPGDGEVWQLAGLFNQSVHGWFVSPPGAEKMYIDKLIVTTRSRRDVP
jgi:hypothetical protein